MTLVVEGKVPVGVVALSIAMALEGGGECLPAGAVLSIAMALVGHLIGEGVGPDWYSAQGSSN